MPCNLVSNEEHLEQPWPDGGKNEYRTNLVVDTISYYATLTEDVCASAFDLQLLLEAAKYLGWIKLLAQRLSVSSCVILTQQLEHVRPTWRKRAIL
jgi:hypothetical protein